MTNWVERRYGLKLNTATQILPVNGSREALFALTQTIIDPTRAGVTVVSPNPFYQIYEGAALLAGAEVYYAPSDPARNFGIDWAAVPSAVWAKTQLLIVCSPWQPDRRGDGPARMEAVVRAERPPRLCHCLRRVLQRNLFPPRATTGQPAGGQRLWAGTILKTWWR
jgi:histidinol-phosphate/aromatic aminotransferase/cobyric acid decarboxylase-like protein